MKKQFLNLGKALNKAEQKQINGGKKIPVDPGVCSCYDLIWQNGMVVGWTPVNPFPECCLEI